MHHGSANSDDHAHDHNSHSTSTAPLAGATTVGHQQVHHANTHGVQIHQNMSHTGDDDQVNDALGPCAESCYLDMLEDWVDVARESNITATNGLAPNNMMRYPKIRSRFCA